jgi:predicted secreted protein
MIVLAVASYIVLWWLAFFAVLPIGVRSHDEAGAPHVAGADRGAPVAPALAKKALAAALIAAMAWAAGYALLASGVVAIRPE